MVQTSALREGTRVRILGPESALGVTLVSPLGTVVGPDEYQGYFLVRLDQPGTFLHPDGRREQIDLVREYWDNLQVVEPAEGER